MDSHHVNHINSNLTITPKHLEIEKLHVFNIVKDVANKYARLINHFRIEYQTVFSARFDEQDEDDQVSHEIELYVNLNIDRSLTESEPDENDFRSQLQHQILNDDTEDSF